MDLEDARRGGPARRKPMLGTSLSTLRSSLASSLLRSGLALPVALLVLPLVLGRVSGEEYGVWVTLSSVVALGGLADAGVKTELSSRIAAAHGAQDSAMIPALLKRGLGLLALSGGTVALLLAALAPWLIEGVFPDISAPLADQATWTLRGLAVLLFLQVLAGGCAAVLVGLQRRDWENYGAVAGLAVGACVTVALLYATSGLTALLCGLASNVVVSAAVHLIGVVRLASFALKVLAPGPVAPSFVGASALLLLAQMSGLLDGQVDKILLSRFVGAFEAGRYQVGGTLAVGVAALVVVPAGLLLAGLPELRARAPERAERLYDVIVRTSYAVAFIGLGGLVALSPSFIRVWVDDAEPLAPRTATLLGVALTVRALGGPYYFQAVASGQHRWIAASAVASAVVNACLSIALVQSIGFDGVLVGSIAANVVGLGVLVLALSRVGSLSIRPGALCAAVAATLPFAVVVRQLLAGNTTTLLSVMLAGLVYVSVAAGLIVLLRVVRLSEVRSALARRS